MSKTDRRASAMKRLESQLKAGQKTAVTGELGNAGKIYDSIPLTEADVKRIKKEIAILKTKIS